MFLEIGSIIVLIILMTMLILILLNNRLPVWFCNNMGWHLTQKTQGFDGCSFTGKCSRCDKSVLMDGQGNWF